MRHAMRNYSSTRLNAVHFWAGFTRIKALAENCQPTVRWVGLTEKYQSGIKFLFKIKLLVASGYAPLVKGLRHSVRFRQKTCGMAWVRFIFLLRNLGIIFYLQSRVAYFAPLVVLRESGWDVLRIFGRAEGFGFTQTVPPIRAPLPPEFNQIPYRGGAGGWGVRGEGGRRGGTACL